MTERAKPDGGRPTLVNDLRAMGAILSAIAAGRQTLLNRDTIPDMAKIAAEGAAEIDRLYGALEQIEAAGLGGYLTPDLCAQIVSQALAEARGKRPAPACPYCGTTKGLRQVCDGGGFTAPEYTCEACFTPSDTGPCFDDLPRAQGEEK